MKKLSKSAFSLLPMLAIALLMLGSQQLRAQIIPVGKSEAATQKIDWREGANRKNATFAQVQAQFKKDWAGKKPKKGEGYKVFKRWEDYMAPRVYPSGNMALPSSTYTNYIAWQKANASQQGKARIAAAASTANFTELNPNAKASGYDAGVGRIDFVRFDPTNPNIMYVCSPDGGLWKSTNGGTTWTTNTDFLPIIGCSDLVIDPTNTQTMYLATGNRENDRKTIGILKSTNGGTTWNTTGLVFQPADDYRIRRLIMDPTNPLVMMAATDGGIYRTTDGWATFTQPTIPGTISLEDIEFKPGDPNTVYAVGKEFFKSTDKGVTWTKITSGLPATANVSRALIAVTAANSAYVYVLYGNADGGYLGTFRSTNSGTSFTQRSSPTSPAGTNNILNCDITTTSSIAQASHNLALVVSPTNAELVTIGGCNVLKSANGGTSWTLSSYWQGLDANYPGEGQGPADYVHADIQSLDYLPGSSTTLFVTCDGGISRSTNNGGNWTDISNNLRVAQMTNVGQSSLTPYNMITGLQDIGTLKNSNGVWTVTNGGDGEDGFIDRTNDNNIITSNPNGAFALSTDAGVTKADITGLPAGLEFLSPIHQDPVNAAVVYAGGRPALYRSTGVLADKDAAWTALGTPAGSGGIKRFEIAPSNNQVIYALRGNSISKSTNGGTTFSNITGTLPVGLAEATNLCVSNTNPNKVWVTFSGYDANTKVYKSVDGGTTWTNVSAGLPNIPMNEIVYTNNSASDAVYVGADIGVYYMDNTTPWTPFFTGLPNSIVRDLEIYYPTGKLRAATYGRGLWESDLFVAPTSYVITASAGPNGSISPTGAVNVSAGANQVFTITPASGFVVQNVLVDGASVGAVTSYTFTNVRATHIINATFAIPQPLSVTLTASVTTGPSTGVVLLTALAAGGRQAYTYAFEGNLGYSDVQDGNTDRLSGLQTGVHNFTVTVTDSSLPTPQIATATVSFTVTGGPVPVVSLSTPTPVVNVGGGSGAKLTQSPNTIKLIRKSANDRAKAADPADDFAIFHFARDNADERLEFDYEITGSATADGVLTFDSQDAFAVGEFEFDLQVFGVSNLETGDDKTLTLTLLEDVHYDVHPEDDAATITFKGSDTPPTTNPDALTITTFNCFVRNGALSSVEFVVGYGNGTFVPALPPLLIVGVTGNGQLGQTYTFAGFDGNVSTLSVQNQANLDTYFVWNFRQACAGPVTPPAPTPPVAPALPNQTATLGIPFSYVVPAFSGTVPVSYSATGLPAGLTFNAGSRTISGAPSLTGVATVVISASNSAGQGSGQFTIAVSTSATPPTGPASLTITRVTCFSSTTDGSLSSVNFVVGYSDGTFTPTVAPLLIVGVTGNGQLGDTYRFAGFDNGVSTLKIQDQASGNTYFVWNFRQACNAPATPPVTPPGPTSLTITSFTCIATNTGLTTGVNFVVGYNNGTFTPAVAPLLIVGVTGNGQLGQKYSFTGFDDSVNTLTVQDQATQNTYFAWNFRAACFSGSARLGIEEGQPWKAVVLGNPPVSEYADIELRNAVGLKLNLSVVDLSGHLLNEQSVRVNEAIQRVRVRLGQSAGVYLLRVSDEKHQQTLRLMRP